jgi:hypothetical protein
LSEERCSLVGAVPKVDLASDENLGSKLVAAIAQSLEKKAKRTAAEEELLRNLRESDEAATARVETFLTACSDRATKDPDAFALDMVKLLSALASLVVTATWADTSYLGGSFSTLAQSLRSTSSRTRSPGLRSSPTGGSPRPLSQA